LKNIFPFYIQESLSRVITVPFIVLTKSHSSIFPCIDGCHFSAFGGSPGKLSMLNALLLLFLIGLFFSIGAGGHTLEIKDGFFISINDYSSHN
jgi:hypothetical protein